MAKYRGLVAVGHALNVALLFIVRNRVSSFIFIVLALIFGFWGVAEFWDLVGNAIRGDLSG
ncbi:MAG: hypothetical protein OSB14_12180 [Planctomycetota bacterium]|nr:hypothetical protein [Planctomycetota bacterium]